MRCLGRTATFKRCKRETQHFFCHHHRFQPVVTIFTILSFVGLLGGIYQDIWKPLFSAEQHSPEKSSSPPPDGAQEIILPTGTATQKLKYVDLHDGCMSVDLWTPFIRLDDYSSEAGEIVTPVPQPKCWYLYDWGIYVEESTLGFIFDHSTSAGLYGIYIPISNDTRVQFNLNISDLQKDDILHIGVFPRTTGNPIDNGTFLTVWKRMRDSEDSYSSLSINKFVDSESDVEGFFFDGEIGDENGLLSVEFEVSKAQLNVFINGSEINSHAISVVYPEPHFWIGIERSILSRLDSTASLHDLEIEIVE